MNTHCVNTSFANELSDLMAGIASFNEVARATRDAFTSRSSSPEKFRGMPDAAYARARVKSLKQRKTSDSCPQSISRLCLLGAERQAEMSVNESSAESPSATAPLQTQMPAPIVVSRRNQLYEVTILTPEILREGCWRQPSDISLSWSSFRALTRVFCPVSGEQEIENLEQYLAALPTRTIVACNNAYLDDLLRAPIKHGRTKEVIKLRQAMRSASVWTEMRVTLRPVSHGQRQERTPMRHLNRCRPTDAAQIKILSNEIQAITDETCRVVCRPPRSPRSNLKNIERLSASDKSSGQL
ncbi:hypothetical protein [Paraburkholderia xenovorans]